MAEAKMNFTEIALARTFPVRLPRPRRHTCSARTVNPFIYLFAALSGALNTVQAGANAQLRKSLGQPLVAGLSVYVTGLAGLLIALPFTSGVQWPKFSQAPWWAWCGGLLSIVSTMAGLLLARKLGSAAFTATTITCALIASVLLDHFGWVGFEVRRANGGRLFGCFLLIAGLAFVTRF